MAQEETKRPEEEQTSENTSQPGAANEPPDPPDTDEIDDGCGGNP
ncbi:MAG TPA: hypothetical protein VK400_03990 [Pyrinomonadaceae bacterium]|nr:hypothetical protein [Pyrinomonadaceae bacterium]